MVDLVIVVFTLQSHYSITQAHPCFSGRVDHHVVLADERVQGAEHLVWVGRASVLGRVRGVDAVLPALLARAVLGVVRGVDPVAGTQRLGEGFEAGAGVRDQRDRAPACGRRTA